VPVHMLLRVHHHGDGLGLVGSGGFGAT
jgi:hypothetical protein